MSVPDKEQEFADNAAPSECESVHDIRVYQYFVLTMYINTHGVYCTWNTKKRIIGKLAPLFHLVMFQNSVTIIYIKIV